MSTIERGRRYVLTANIKDLQSKFRQADDIIKKNTRELNKLSKALKIDTHNIDTMVAKWNRLRQTIDINEQAIKNLKQQMRLEKELNGVTNEFHRLKTAVGVAEARAKSLKQDFKELGLVLNKANFHKEFDTLTHKVEKARGNVQKLDEALKLNPNSLSIATHKLEEMGKESQALNQKILLLKNRLESLDPKLYPDDIRKFRVELTKAEVEAEKLASEMKKLSHNNSDFARSYNSVNKQISEARHNAEKLEKALKIDPRNFNLLSGKLSEMKREFTALAQKSEILNKELKNINPNLHPEKFRELRIELDKSQSEAKELSNSIKTLTNQRLNSLKTDFTEIDKAIEKSSSNVKELSNHLKAIGGSDLVRKTRLQEFNNTLEKSETKVRLLKRELAKIDAKVDVDEFVRLNRELNKAETNVKQLKSQMGLLDNIRVGGIAQGFNHINSSINKSADSMAQFGRNYTLGVTLPIAYGGKRMIDSFRETDDALRKVAAAGASDVEGGFTVAFEQVERVARKTSQGSVYSMREVSEGMEELVKAGWSVSDSGKQVAHVMNMAKVEGMELGRASEIVTDGLSAFGLKANETQRFVDVLTKASVESTTDITKMGETFKYVAPIAGQLGFTIEDVGVAIGLMANKGIKASVAGTSLRGGMANLVKPSKQARAALESIGFSMTDVDGKTKSLSTVIAELRQKTSSFTDTQKVAFATTVFGKTAMSGWSAILKSTDEEVAKLTNSIKDSSGATKEMADNLTSGVGGAVDRFKAQMSNAANDIGNKMEPTLRVLLGTVGGVTEAFANSNGAMIQWTIGFTALVGAIPPAVGVFGYFKKGLNQLDSGISAINGKLGKLGKGLALPSAGTIAGAVAITAAFAMIGEELYKTTDHYKNIQAAQSRFDNSLKELSKTTGSMTTHFSEMQRTMDAMPSIFAKPGADGERFAMKLADLSTDIAYKHDAIIDIMANASNKMAGISQSEINSVNTNVSTISEKLSQKATILDTMYTQMSNKTKGFIKLTGLSNEQYIKEQGKLLNSIKEYKDEAMATNLEWYQTEMLANESRVGSAKRTTDDIDAELKRRNDNTNIRIQELEAILNAEVEKRNERNEGTLNKLAEFTKSVEEAERKHKENLELLEQGHAGKMADTQMLKEQADEKHKIFMQNNSDAIKTIMQDLNNEEGRLWLERIAQTINNGGELTAKQSEFVENIKKVWSSLPPETQEQVKAMFEAAGLQMDLFDPIMNGKMKTVGNSTGDGYRQGLSDMQPSIITTAEAIANGASSIIKKTDFSPSGKTNMTGLNTGLLSGKSLLSGTVTDLMKTNKSKIESTDFKGAGDKNMSDLNSGIENKKGYVENTAKNVALSGMNAAKSVDFSPAGAAAITGIQNGANANRGYLNSTMQAIARGALAAAMAELKVNSPSKVFRDKVGKPITEGWALGVDQNAPMLMKSITTTAQDAIKKAESFDYTAPLNTSLRYTIGTNVAMEHSMKQTDTVIGTLNTVIDRLNNLELKSNVYMDGTKVGEITYKEHLRIESRELSY